MGVHSFWDIAGPTARPVRLESLQDKKMAVDASIWIYQFLKAVRDREGNAIKHAHIIGFFRRICKLLYFGIRPVFVFDGGVPVLKRDTINQRKERRQGKRDDAATTARKLLAVQLQKQQEASLSSARDSGVKEEQKDQVIFRPQDEWDLPHIPGFRYDIDDERIETPENFKNAVKAMEDELDKIDLDTINPASREFEELPKATQYMILSKLRLRSRLRMGYSKEQLEEIFPDSMDFSKFQIDMVKKRNFYTQKLINITGLHDGGASKLNDEIINRIAGKNSKEYKLTKTDTGWILGLGSNDGSEVDKAITLDENGNIVKDISFLNDETGTAYTDGDEDDEAEWEDVDIIHNETNKVEDYSLKASKLPPLNEKLRDAGSQSFLDKRHDEPSPKKNDTQRASRVMMNRDKKLATQLRFDDDDDDDFENHFRDVKSYEEAQNSVQQLQQQALKQVDKLSVSPPRKNSTDLNLSEGEKNLNLILDKISTSTEDKLGKSFLFSEPTVSSNVVDERKAHQESKPVVPETPKWFSTSTGGIASNPFVISDFVSKVGDDFKEKEDLREEKSYELFTGTEAQRAIDKSINHQDKSIETVEIVDEYQNSKSDDTASTHTEITVPTSDIESNKPLEEKQQGRQPLVFDYSFSEDEEENLAETIRKEGQEFSAFTSSLGNNAMDNAFMEDELFQQQVKNKRDSDEVTPDMILDVQELLSRFGIPYITAPMEAEAQCAELLSLKLVDGVITDDSDVFLFGGTKIYKNMFHERNYVEYYDAKSILTNLGLDRTNMIELAQLLGSDYTTGIKGMGPVNSMEVIAEFGTLENFRNWYNEGQFDKQKQANDSKFQKDLRKRLVKNEIFLDSDFPSKLVFEAYMRPEVDHDKTEFQWGTPDLDMLRTFMRDTVGWPKEKSDEVLIPLIRDINARKKKGKQRTLSEFLSVDVLDSNKKLNLGKRIIAATDKIKKRRLK